MRQDKIRNGLYKISSDVQNGGSAYAIQVRSCLVAWRLGGNRARVADERGCSQMNNISALEINSVRQFMVGVRLVLLAVSVVSDPSVVLPCSPRPRCVLLVAEQVLPPRDAQQGRRCGDLHTIRALLLCAVATFADDGLYGCADRKQATTTSRRRPRARCTRSRLQVRSCSRAMLLVALLIAISSRLSVWVAQQKKRQLHAFVASDNLASAATAASRSIRCTVCTHPESRPHTNTHTHAQPAASVYARP